jgi:hypothetical protein
MGTLTLAEINRLNSEFWKVEHDRMKSRMADDAVPDTAFETLAAEIEKGDSVQRQTSLYEALARAEQLGRRFISQHSRKGGQAAKTDRLQLLIERLVEGNLKMSEPELQSRLRALQKIDPIQDVEDGVIFFTNHGDRTKPAKVSGLKDLSLSKTQTRTYRWCSPPKTGTDSTRPVLQTSRRTGASFCNDRCVRTSL